MITITSKATACFPPHALTLLLVGREIFVSDSEFKAAHAKIVFKDYIFHLPSGPPPKSCPTQSHCN